MKRFHVHVAVKDLASSIRFYSTLFGAEPTVTKSDYAKWMVDDPRINFAISERGARTGVNHLGLQVDSDEELEQNARAGPACGSSSGGREERQLLLRAWKQVLVYRSTGCGVGDLSHA